MTIASENRKAGPYTGNGVTTAFAFAFKVFSSADVLVLRTLTSSGVTTTLAINTDYTVTLNADQNANPGGSVTLVTALATGYTLVLSSEIEYKQLSDITNNGGFYPTVVTNALDKLTILTQQLFRMASRSIRQPESDADDMAELPAKAQRGGLYLAFDASGDPVASTGTGADAGLRGDLASISGATLVHLLQGGGIQDAIPWLTPEMYGATAGTVCSDQIENWLNSTYRKLKGGNGVYLVSRVLSVGSALSYKNIEGYAGYNDVAVSTEATIIKGTHAGVIISYTGAEHFEMSHIKFAGAGCSALKQSTLANYTAFAHIHHCDFDAGLVDCLYFNPILCTIEKNVMGYHGTPGAAHRHIYAEGGIAGANYANNNHIIKNRCYQAVGSFSMQFKNGDRLYLQGNNFEQNNCPSLKITGIEYTTITADNWFEQNNVGAPTPYEIYLEDGDASHPVRSLIVDRNAIGPHASMTHFIKTTSTSLRIFFTHNDGPGWAGKYVTDYNGTNDGGICEYEDNTLTGYSRSNYNVTKPLNDAFHAYHDNGVANFSGDGTVYTIPYNIVAQSNIGTYDAGTYTHTAAVSGVYNYNVGVNLTGLLNTHTAMAVNLVTSNRTYSTSFHPYNMANAAGGLGDTFDFQVPMDAGDTAYVTITIAGGTKVVDLTTLTNWFSGAHVG